MWFSSYFSRVEGERAFQKERRAGEKHAVMEKERGRRISTKERERERERERRGERKAVD